MKNDLEKFKELSVFKFRSADEEYDIPNLLNNEIWCPKFEELNDPFDGCFNIDKTPPDNDLLIKFLTRQYKNTPNLTTPPRTEARR